MTAQGKGYRFFRVIGFRRDLSSARNAVGYAAFRSEAVRDKAALIFDARTDSADVKSFLASLKDPLTEHNKVAKAYHTLFSLPRDAYDRAAVRWPEVVRQVLRGYELETGRKLTWIAVEHNDRKHPHAHVIIKATYQDKQGRNRRLFLGKGELDRIKANVGRALEARGLEVDRSQAGRLKPREPAERSVPAAATGAMLGWIQQQIRASRQRQLQEQAHAAREWVRRPGRER